MVERNRSSIVRVPNNYFVLHTRQSEHCININNLKKQFVYI